MGNLQPAGVRTNTLRLGRHSRICSGTHCCCVYQTGKPRLDQQRVAFYRGSKTCVCAGHPETALETGQRDNTQSQRLKNFAKDDRPVHQTQKHPIRQCPKKLQLYRCRHLKDIRAQIIPIKPEEKAPKAVESLASSPLVYDTSITISHPLRTAVRRSYKVTKKSLPGTCCVYE